jgi:DNA polymerase III epsilon subunit-like protein/tetratricopeptide (TPR) repeat protein
MLFSKRAVLPEQSAVKPSGFVVVDIEPTGFAVATDRVYEIGIVTLSPSGAVTDRYETLVRPDSSLSPRLGRALEHAPSFADIAGDVVERLRLGLVAGHNAHFDLSMIDAELGRLDAGLPSTQFLDTLAITSQLNIDTPSRRLGMVCHVLGVEMHSWHTAATDADATARLLMRLLEIATERGLLAQSITPSMYEGSAAYWPTFPSTGRTLRRDPVLLPPLGEQPDDLDVLDTGYPSLSLTIELTASPDLLAKASVALMCLRLRKDPLPPDTPSEILRLVPDLHSADLALACSAARRINDFLPPPAPDPADEAHDDFDRGKFVGKRGIERLRRIVQTFEAAEDDDLVEARLQLATLLRYTPGHAPSEVVSTYAAAMVDAKGQDEREGIDENGSDSAVPEVYADWMSYLIAQRDIESIADLTRASASRPQLDPSVAVTFVHALRTHGELDFARTAAEIISVALASSGRQAAAADISSEWAHALADAGKLEEALAVCQQASASGWSSRQLVNRHSLLLERAKRWSEAVDLCERGLQLFPDDEQISRRRTRCQHKLT